MKFMHVIIDLKKEGSRMNLSMVELLYDIVQERPEMFFPKDKQYDMAMDKLCEIEVLAKEKFTGEQMKIFEQFDDKQSDINCITNQIEYKNGFISGFLLCLEIFNARCYHVDNE